MLCTEPASIEDGEGEVDGEMTVVEGRELMLPCRVAGLPTPRVHWTKDNVTVLPDKQPRYHIIGPAHSLAIAVVR